MLLQQETVRSLPAGTLTRGDRTPCLQLNSNLEFSNRTIWNSQVEYESHGSGMPPAKTPRPTGLNAAFEDSFIESAFNRPRDFRPAQAFWSCRHPIKADRGLTPCSCEICKSQFKSQRQHQITGQQYADPSPTKYRFETLSDEDQVRDWSKASWRTHTRRNQAGIPSLYRQHLGDDHHQRRRSPTLGRAVDASSTRPWRKSTFVPAAEAAAFDAIPESQGSPEL